MSGDLFGFDHYAEPVLGMQNRGAILQTHSADKCAGTFCVLHNPSDHHMRDWPTNYRGDRNLTERLCEHGVGHPDPDDLAYKVSLGRTHEGVHGCCGCCVRPS